MKKILIVENDINTTQLIQNKLKESGYEVFGADTFQKADNILENQIINLMIIDSKWSADTNSRDWIHSRNSKKLLTPPFIISIKQGEEYIALEMMKMGARDYLLKDSTLSSCLINVVKRVLKEIEQEEKNALSQQALEENEIRYRMLFEKNPEPMFIIGKDLRFLEVNDAAVKHYGYSREEFLSLTITEIRPQEEDVDLMHEKVNQASKNKLTKSVTRHIKKNGEIIIVEVTPALTKWHNQIALHILVNDITEKIKAQEKLQQKRIRLRKILEESTHFIQAQTGKIDFVKVTDIMMEISGAKVVAFSRFIDDGETYITKGFSGLGNFAKDSMNILGFNLLEKVWKTDLAFSSTLKNGTIQYVKNIKELEDKILSTTIIQIITDSFIVGEIILVPVIYEKQLMAVFTLIFKRGDDVFSDNEVVEIFSSQIALYIARVRAERAILKSQEKYRYLFENNPQPMMIFDVKSLVFLEVNNAALKLYGYSKEEFLKLKLLDLRSTEEVSALIDLLPEFKKDVEMNITTIHQTKNNESYQVELSSTPIIFEDKKARHLLVVKHTKLEK